MQRASVNPHSPITEPSSKRRRIDPSSGVSTPSRTTEQVVVPKATPTPTRVDYGRDDNETEWVLKISKEKQPYSTSYQQEEEGTDIWATTPTGRQTYGNFKRKKDKPGKTSTLVDKDDEELSSAPNSASDSDDDTPRKTAALQAGLGPSRFQNFNNSKSPLSRPLNHKERKKQNRAPKKKTARKTM
jgi:hypothetical protein